MKWIASLLKSSLFYTLVAILVVIFIERYFARSNHETGYHGQDSQTNNFQQKTLTNCQVDSVIDGDSLLANCNGRVYSVRLESIDAPELSQGLWGKQSKTNLQKIIKSQQVTLKISGIDRYQRYLATVFVKNVDIGLQQVKAGHAVVYRRYQPPVDYLSAMKSAKKSSQGVWSKEGLQQNPQHYRRLAQ